MSQPEQALEYESEYVVNMCICYFEGGVHSNPTLSVLESALSNLITSGTPEDQQVARIIRDDLYSMIPVNSPASVESEHDYESESEDELNRALISSPVSAPTRRVNLLSPIYETPYRPLPPFPSYEVIESSPNSMDETIEWAEDAFDADMCRVAARYDTFCSCCNHTVKIELFH